MELLLRLSTTGIIWLSVLLGIVVISVVLFFVIFPVSLWIRLRVSNAPVKMSKLMAMKLRKVDMNSVVVAYITAKRSGLDLDVSDMETQVLAGGNIDNVIKAMIAANNAGINLPLKLAMALDLSGKDVVNIISGCITPKIMDTPFVTATAQDGFQVTLKASVTMIGNIKRIAGGADENTIILRVSEALSSIVGSATTHQVVMENPDVISDTIMNRGLDYETAFEILSVDIFDMKLGKNILTEQKLEEVELQKKSMQSKLETRRLEAVALEQENKAKIQELQAKKIEMEAEVPKALAKALNDGKISPVEYYDIQNLEADTNLRNTLTKKAEQKPEPKQDALKPRRNPFNFN